MNETLPKVLRLGGATPIDQVAKRTATGIVALCHVNHISILFFLRATHLQHLDKRNTEIQVCFISADQAQAEEETDWENGSEVDTTGHLDGFAAIEQSGGLRQDLGHDCRKYHVPAY
jgi:hypothetical protein